MRKKRLITYSIVILVCVAIGAAYIISSWVFGKYEYEAARVDIPAGISNDSVRTIFKDALGKSYGRRLALMWQLQGGNAAESHGSYLVEPGQSVVKVARTIARGRPTPVRFTFNNLRLYTDLASRASKCLEFDSTAFMHASDSILSPLGYSEEEYAAAVLPDTYEFYWTVSPAEVVSTLNKHREKFWTDERKAKAEKLGITPKGAHTIASIVEEETNRADERAKVARLYLNRLDKGMYLQADPTVKFAMRKFALRRISLHQTKYESPYNTYRNHGLPPGPIRIAEAATIDDVLNAPMHNYLFMCARSDFSGYHDFTETYDRHRINSARYHRALDERGVSLPATKPLK